MSEWRIERQTAIHPDLIWDKEGDELCLIAEVYHADAAEQIVAAHNAAQAGDEGTVARYRQALEAQQTAEDHSLECLRCLHGDDCVDWRRLTADANVARADALAHEPAAAGEGWITRQHAFVPLSGSQDTSGEYQQCSVVGCRLGPEQHRARPISA